MAATAALGFGAAHTVAQASTIAVVDGAIAKVSEEEPNLVRYQIDWIVL